MWVGDSQESLDDHYCGDGKYTHSLTVYNCWCKMCLTGCMELSYWVSKLINRQLAYKSIQEGATVKHTKYLSHAKVKECGAWKIFSGGLVKFTYVSTDQHNINCFQWQTSTVNSWLYCGHSSSGSFNLNVSPFLASLLAHNATYNYLGNSNFEAAICMFQSHFSLPTNINM